MAIERALAGLLLAASVLGGCGGGGGGGDGAPSVAGTSGVPAPPPAGGTGTVVPPAPAVTPPGGIGSTPTPVSAAMQVNTLQDGNQTTPSLATLADGSYVIAWHTEDAPGNGIFVRRFTAAGTPMEPQTRIDDALAGRPVSVAKVGALEGGGFAVAWQSRTVDFDQWMVHVRHVRADGSFGAVQAVPVRWFQTYELTSLAGGGYALLLQGPLSADPADQQLRIQRYGPDDVLLDTRLVDTALVLQNSVHAVRLAGGRRLLTWVRNDLERGTAGLFFRFMDAAGVLEPLVRAGGTVPGAFATYVPAALPDGGFVLTGVDFTEGGTGQAVWAQRFASDAVAAGPRVRVDDEADVAALGTACLMPTKGGPVPCPFPWQSMPAVAATADGGFVVAWDTPDRQRPGRSVYWRKFDPAAQPTGPPVAVAADAADPAQGQAVAGSVGTGFVLAWVGRDADQSGIEARQYR